MRKIYANLSDLVGQTIDAVEDLGIVTFVTKEGIIRIHADTYYDRCGDYDRTSIEVDNDFSMIEKVQYEIITEEERIEWEAQQKERERLAEEKKKKEKEEQELRKKRIDYEQYTKLHEKFKNGF
jgi:hypothetical protein